MLSWTTDTGGSREAAHCRKHGSWAWFWLCTILPAHASLLQTWLICFEEVGVWGADHVTVLFGVFSDGKHHFLWHTGNSVPSLYTVCSSPSVRVSKTMWNLSPFSIFCKFAYVQSGLFGLGRGVADLRSYLQLCESFQQNISLSSFFLKGIINWLSDCM